MEKRRPQATKPETGRSQTQKHEDDARKQREQDRQKVEFLKKVRERRSKW